MKKPIASKTNAISVRPTDDGLHLDGSILWLDSHGNGELSFLSSASQNLAAKVPQVIATEETVKILEAKRKKPNALVCQYNRPFSIGKLKMELLPSGSVLGGASLHIETDKGRILYAPLLQTQKVPTVRQMQLKKANTLILGAYHPDPNSPLPNRKKEKDRLLNAIRKSVSEGKYPVIMCQPIATAQELTKMLTEEGIPVAAHSAIHKINKVYEAYGSSLGHYSLYSPRQRGQKVLLIPLQPGTKKQLRQPLPDGPLFVIEETVDPNSATSVLRDVAERFYISSSCDGKELKEVIAAVAPKEVYIFGPYAKRYCEELRNTCGKVKPLYPNDQPTLF